MRHISAGLLQGGWRTMNIHRLTVRRPYVTEYTYSRVVGLRLEGNLVETGFGVHCTHCFAYSFYFTISYVTEVLITETGVQSVADCRCK